MWYSTVPRIPRTVSSVGRVVWPRPQANSNMKRAEGRSGADRKGPNTVDEESRCRPRLPGWMVDQSMSTRRASLSTSMPLATSRGARARRTLTECAKVRRVHVVQYMLIIRGSDLTTNDGVVLCSGALDSCTSTTGLSLASRQTKESKR